CGARWKAPALIQLCRRQPGEKQQAPPEQRRQAAKAAAQQPARLRPRFRPAPPAPSTSSPESSSTNSQRPLLFSCWLSEPPVLAFICTDATLGSQLNQSPSCLSRTEARKR